MMEVLENQHNIWVLGNRVNILLALDVVIIILLIYIILKLRRRDKNV